MKTLIACVAILFAGCATQKSAYLPDGTKGHSINCSGGALNWGMCYEKAGELCKERGYEVIDKSGDESGSIIGNQYGVYGAKNANRSLLIKCKSE